MSITKRNSKFFAIVTANDGLVKERAKEYEDFEWSAGRERVEAFMDKHPGAIFSVFVRIPA